MSQLREAIGAMVEIIERDAYQLGVLQGRTEMHECEAAAKATVEELRQRLHDVQVESGRALQKIASETSENTVPEPTFRRAVQDLHREVVMRDRIIVTLLTADPPYPQSIRVDIKKHPEIFPIFKPLKNKRAVEVTLKIQEAHA